jgi:integrase
MVAVGASPSDGAASPSTPHDDAACSSADIGTLILPQSHDPMSTESSDPESTRTDAVPKAGAPKGGTSRAKDVTKRLKCRNGRYYLDLRDMGHGREALIPDGSTYATRDQLVAISLAGQRLEALLRPEHERYFRRNELARVVTVGAFAREWLVLARDRAGEGFASARTLLRYEQAFKQAFNARDKQGEVVLSQDLRIDQVTVAHVKRLFQALRTTITRAGARTSASSIHQIITGMQLVFDHASDEGVVPKDYNPWRNLRRQDRPSLPRQSSTDFLEIYEAHALLSASENAELVEIPIQAIASTYLHTGGRKAEVLGLERENLDFERKVVRFVSNQYRTIKDYDERSVPMWPALEKDLRRHLEECPSTSSLVFEGRSKTGRPQMITSYHKAFQRVKWAAAGLLEQSMRASFLKKEINPRVLRVTYCSARLQTLDRGAPVASWTVESEMGHASGKMIKRVYGRLGTVRHRSEVVEYVPREEDLVVRAGSPMAHDDEGDKAPCSPQPDTRHSA